MLHRVPVAVVEIGADEVGLPLVDIVADLHGAVPHPVVHGGGLDAVPVDGVGRRPMALGLAVEDRPPGHPDGGAGITAVVKGVVLIPEGHEHHILEAVPGGNHQAVQQVPLHRVALGHDESGDNRLHKRGHGVGGLNILRRQRALLGRVPHLGVHPLHAGDAAARYGKSGPVD